MAFLRIHQNFLLRHNVVLKNANTQNCKQGPVYLQHGRKTGPSFICQVTAPVRRHVNLIKCCYTENTKGQALTLALSASGTCQYREPEHRWHMSLGNPWPDLRDLTHYTTKTSNTLCRTDGGLTTLRLTVHMTYEYFIYY